MDISNIYLHFDYIDIYIYKYTKEEFLKKLPKIYIELLHKEVTDVYTVQGDISADEFGFLNILRADDLYDYVHKLSNLDKEEVLLVLSYYQAVYEKYRFSFLPKDAVAEAKEMCIGKFENDTEAAIAHVCQKYGNDVFSDLILPYANCFMYDNYVEDNLMRGKRGYYFKSYEN